uniref:Uncharacterized protein n=1 Tax=Opuntia streptacantha TaxID=393608 RepID=A0A7C9EAB9_OPUST
MAASSPALSNNGGESTPSTSASTPPPPPAAVTSTTPVKNPAFPTITLQRPDPPKNLRGLNKPKCIKCGNVARSRCPYQSCKSCCSKAQNPCHIHVLKPNATLADRGASTNSSTPQQQPNEAPPSGSSAKVSSLRQLSSTFSQFNNVHIPLRSRKPVTRKEALAINEWRFAKLKECKERNIEAENEAFDRYMQNISLLEEIFDVNLERQHEDACQVSSPAISGNQKEAIMEIKVKLRSNPMRIDKFRKRIQQTVDEDLRKLQKHDLSNDDGSNNVNDEADLDPAPKAEKDWWAGKTSPWAELNDRLSKARNVEDLKLCIEMRSKFRSQQKIPAEKTTEGTEIPEEQAASNDFALGRESDFCPMKLVRNIEIDQDTLSSMDSHFSSLEEIEDL